MGERPAGPRDRRALGSVRARRRPDRRCRSRRPRLRPPRDGRLRWPARRHRRLVDVPRRPRRPTGGRPHPCRGPAGRALRALARRHDLRGLPADRAPEAGCRGADLPRARLDRAGLEAFAGSAPERRGADDCHPQRDRWVDAVARPIRFGQDSRRPALRQDEHGSLRGAGAQGAGSSECRSPERLRPADARPPWRG